MRKNTILNVDCLSAEGLRMIPDETIDLILCDLPYEKTQNKWDILLPLDLLWKEYERVIKPHGAIVLTASQPFTSLLVMSNPKLFRYDLVWEKTTPTGFLNANRMPLRSHEDILVFYKKLPTYHPQKTTGHPASHTFTKHTSDGSNYGNTKSGLSGGGSTERYPKSVLTFATDKQKEHYHSTQKPVALCEYLIQTFSNPGDVVLDNTAGSFTTAVACDNTNRNWICMEKETKFSAIGWRRVNRNRERLGLEPVKLFRGLTAHKTKED